MNRITMTALGLVLAAGTAAACPQYDDVVAAVQADDEPRAAELMEAIATTAECDDALREWVGDYLAKKRFAFAVQEAATPDEKRSALQQALGYEKHWRSYAELGRIDWNRKNYRDAATAFQLAINELVEGDPTHEATEDEIAEVYQLASASMALADAPVEMPKTRSGTAGGIFNMKVRGFEVEEVPLPITFEFDSTTFDAAGAIYANALVDHVMMLAPGSVRLAGHTDPKGDETYNLGLSEARAKVLGDLLRSAGFDGEIEIAAYGETKLPEPPAGIEPMSEEHFRIARRVAFSAE